jgi:hypothetical protein
MSTTMYSPLYWFMNSAEDAPATPPLYMPPVETHLVFHPSFRKLYLAG